MKALFVHGMGRTPLSGWPLLWHLRRAGLKTNSFAYLVTVEDFSAITKRLAARISAIASEDEYLLIGHSLGGVLIRAAVNSLSPEIRRPSHIFLLGSPVRPARLAQRLRHNPVFRILTRDCGQLLGSAQRMSEIRSVSVPVIGIAGVKGLFWKQSPFDGELNDGVVSLSEVSAEWLAEQIQLPMIHTLLPSSRQVARIILERVRPNHS